MRIAVAIVMVAACGLQVFPHASVAAEIIPMPAGTPSADTAVRTRHVIAMGGEQLAYTAIAGTLGLRLERTDAEATIFFVSYQRDGEDPATRPITFVFNGGPGSSAAWLHVVGLGPRRLFLHNDGGIPDSPARLVDNAQTWLRFTDLVFVDPVGTGFSRALPGPEQRSDKNDRPFWGVKSDLRSLSEFVRLYLTRYARWASPKYLAGESYGGFRAAALVELLPVKGIQLSGAILISPVIEYKLNLGNDYFDVMPWVTFVPSYAATAFRHGKYRAKNGGDLRQIAQAAEAFSRTDLLLTLASNAPRKSAATSEVFAHLADITGLDVACVQYHRGRLTAEVFAKRLLEDRGRVVGIYDGSVSAPDPNPFSTAYAARDPSYDPLIAPVTTSVNAYVRNELGYKTDARYELMNADALQAWNWTEGGESELPGVGANLRSGLSLNPDLKVLIAHGYFDLATPYFASKYLIERLELDDASFPNLRLSLYPGGHMFYTRTDAREQLYRDVQALYETPYKASE